MLTENIDIKQHDELILEKNSLCIQLEGGNPFLPNQDFTFSPKEKNLTPNRVVYQKVSLFNTENDVFKLWEKWLDSSLKRSNRIPNNPHIINSLALNYLRIGDIGNAIEELKQALTIDKNYFPALANLARCYIICDDWENAQLIYKQLEDAKPNDVRILTNIGSLSFKMKNLDLALHYFKRALAVESDNSSVLNNLGLVYLLQKKTNEAISVFRKALIIKNDDFGIYNNLGVCFAVRENFRKAISNFEIAYSLNKGNRDTVHNLSGAYQAKGEHEKVINLLDDYLKTHPQEVAFRNIIAWSYFQLKLFQRCLKELETALKNTKPEASRSRFCLLNNIGVSYNHLNDKNKAKQYFIKSLEIEHKENILPFFNLIELFYKLNNLEEAKKVIGDALIIHPENSLLLTYLGDYYFKKNEYHEAKNILKRVIELNPNCLKPYLLISTIEADVFVNIDNATSILEEGLKKYPKSISLINNYAYCLLMQNELSAAKSILEKVKEENDVYLTATKGLLLIKEGNLKEGRRYYNKAISLASKNLNLAKLVNQKKYLELGKHYFKKGDMKEATQLLKKGLSFKTREQYYRRNIEELLRRVLKSA